MGEGSRQPVLVVGAKGMLGEPVARRLAADDCAATVSKAIVTPEAAGTTLYVYGPEAHTFEEALRIHQPICAPEAKIAVVPFWVLRLMSWMPGRGRLRRVGLPIMRYFTKVEEVGDAGGANALLGAPTTTIRQWCAARAGSAS